MSKKNDSILLSPKHGVNPSVLHCVCCGDSYGVALLGKLKEDKEAPRDIYDGLCDKCQGVINQEGTLCIEVKDGEKGDNPCRTGRIVGISKDCKIRWQIEDSIVYMEETLFTKLFGDNF